MKVRVDPDLCAGCGVCPELCPRIFEMDGGLAIVILNPVPEECEKECQDAADGCPCAAIIIE